MISGGLALGWALFIAGATLQALWPRPRPPQTPSKSPPIPTLLVRPCAGAEPGLTGRLQGGAEAASVVRFIVGSSVDPAGVAAEEAARRLRARGIDAARLVHATDAPNRKAAHLTYAADLYPDHALISADSDVELRAADVSTLIEALDGGAAAAWSPPVERPQGWSWGDRASAGVLNASLHAFPLLSRLDPGCFVGKCFALAPSARRRLGGLAAFEDRLAEDMALGAALAALGARVVAVGGVTARPPSRSLRAIAARYHRWLLALKAQRPWALLGYPALLAATPLLVLLGAGSGPLGWAAAALALAARAAAGLYGARGDRRLAAPWVWLLADALLLWAWLRALISPHVIWRGRRLEVVNGRLRARP